MSIKVAIVEDDSEIRELTYAIIDHYDDFECVGLYENASKFEKSLSRRKQPEVVLMDITMPGKSGIQCVDECHSRFPKISFIMFTSNEDSKQVFAALAAGALGYVVKGGRPEQIANAIREVKAGGSPMSRQISRLVAQSFLKTEKAFPELESLSTQEREVLRLLDEGLSYKEISARRFVSRHTVRSQVQSIYRKLHVHSRTEALNIYHGRKGKPILAL